MNVRSGIVLLASLALLPASALADNTTGTAPPAKADPEPRKGRPDGKDAEHRNDAVNAELRAAAVAAAGAPTPPGTDPSTATVRVSTALASVGTTTAQANAGAGAAKSEQGPHAASDVTVGATKPLAGPRALRRMDAERVMLSLQDAFVGCYTRSDSRSSGSVVIRANTSGTGQVESTEVASQEGLPWGVVQCVSDRVRELHFRAPGGNGLAVLVPVRFGPRS
jgi:hypothetical protein